jgi:hypothetical protein
VNDNELSLSLTDHRAHRRPGETVEFSGLWALQKSPASLEARLFWFTRGKGTEDVGIIATEPVTSPESAGEQRFRFVLPNGPYSFSGQLVSLIWAVELVADGRVARTEFVVTPDGREIVLDGDPRP